MVAVKGHPLKGHNYTYIDSRWPLLLRLRGTVILRIWWQIVLVAIFSTAVWALHTYTSWAMNYGLSLTTVLGVVTGLLLVFRTNTAYDRYWEGRRLWSQMTVAIRTMARCFWVGVKENNTRDLLEKKSAINLLIAFAYSTKHYLRDEFGYDHDDMAGLLSHIPKYSIPSAANEWVPRDVPVRDPTQPVMLAEQRPSGLGSALQPQRSNLNSIMSDHSHSHPPKPHKKVIKNGGLAFESLAPTNIPLELSYYLASYIQTCRSTDKMDIPTTTIVNNALGSLVDALSALERILRTPIPLAYSIHLHHVTWLYLLALPFQLVQNLGAVMIPAVALASFTLLGILGIGFEIENPFSDDYNDLPLDDFCRVIQAEVEALLAEPAPVPSQWIFSEHNHPLSPLTDFTAEELLSKSLDEVHAILAINRRPVINVRRCSSEVDLASGSNAAPGSPLTGLRSRESGNAVSITIPEVAEPEYKGEKRTV